MSEYRLSDYQRPRLNILRNSSRNGLVIPLGQYQNIEGLKDEICEKLGMRDVRHLYNPHGCEITDLSLIRDDDVIIAAMNKEKFRKPGKKEINAKEVSTNAFYTLFKEILKIAMKTLVQVLKENIASAAITA